MWELRDEHKKMTASAIASGSHQRPWGTDASHVGSASGYLASIFWVWGVRTRPGATAFTRIPCVAYCSAALFVRPETPCFVATPATGPAAPTSPPTEPLFTIAPPPRFSISGISYFMESQTPVRLIATT